MILITGVSGQMKIDASSYQAQTLLTMFQHYNEHCFRGNSVLPKAVPVKFAGCS